MTAQRSFFLTNAPWLSAGVLLTFLSSFGQTYFISLFSGEIRTEFGLSHAAWGGIYSLGTTASALVMIWAGGLTDTYRSRALGTLVLIFLAFACVLMAVNPWAALLPLVIFCLRFSGQGMVSHIAVVSMSRWFVANRGKALAIAGLGFAVGEAVLPIVFVAALAIVDWRMLWGVAALVALLGIPVLRGLLRQERTPKSHAESDVSLGMNQLHWTRVSTLRHPLIWFMVPALLGPAAFNTAFFFQQVYYAEIKGFAHLQLVTLFPLYTGVAVVSMIVSGVLLDRFGTPRVIPWFQIPMVAGFATFAMAQTIGGAAIGLVLIALTTGANATLPNAFWAEFYGTRHLGSIKAMAAAVMVLGSALGPGLTGVLIDAGVPLDHQYLGVALYFVGATVLMWIGVQRARPLLIG